MPPTSPADGPVRSVEQLNTEIRALFTHRDARLSDEQREEYRRLLAELQQVEREDVTAAA